jgi:hypothetical protein
MARTLSLILIAVSGASLAGCARTTLLINRNEGSQSSTTSTTGNSTTTPATTTTSGPSPEAQAYLAALSREQAKLAAAERKIPRRARTPAALARSIRLLRQAIVQLGNDLKTISPPASVASQHAQLVSTVQTYAVRLAAAQHVSTTRGGELRAIRMLISATTAASSAFGSTVNQINAALQH